MIKLQQVSKIVQKLKSKYIQHLLTYVPEIKKRIKFKGERESIRKCLEMFQRLKKISYKMSDLYDLHFNYQFRGISQRNQNSLERNQILIFRMTNRFTQIFRLLFQYS